MSEPATPARPFYVAGGTLKPGEPSYVERRADTELYESSRAGEFCYVLTARQMGKSSLMARTAKRLEQAGVASAIVDLTQIGSERGGQAAAQWYFGIANVIHRQLGISVPLRPWWQERADLSSVQRLTDFFRELVLAHCPGRVVVFVDEIDSTIGLPFADDFFAALRACFNARATDDAFERLTFVLLGVASPDQLIKDPARTPFNIGKRIDLTDFHPDEAQVLAPGLHPDAGEAGRRLERVLHWTGGHPYLTQALCRAVREREGNGTAEEVVDPQVEELFLSSRAQREETNLKHARARLEKPGPEGRRLLQLYRRVRQGRPVADQPTSPLFAQLKLAGVVKATDEGRLAVRNRIYEAVFTPEWAKSAMPADRGRQLAAATMAAVFAGVLVWYAAFQPRPYVQAFQTAMEDDGYYTAIEAYANLRANPFSRSRATELMQQFWEQRALRYALAGKRGESLLCSLQELSLKDDEWLRRQAGNLVGSDYERLRLTLWHAGGVRAVAFSPDGRTLVTASDNNTARLWDAHTGEPLVPLQHKSRVVAVAFSPDGRTVATGSWDNTAQLWEASSGKRLAIFQHQDPVVVVAFSPDGRICATGSQDFTARLWDARTGKPLGLPLQHESVVFVVAFSPDGRTVATGSGDNTARLWDTRTGKPLASPLQHKESVFAVAFSLDSRTVATGSGDKTARLWGARTGQPLTPPLQHKDMVVAVAFSPDGLNVATGSEDGTVRLWDARSGKSLTSPLQHQSSVIAMAFSPKGQAIVTGSVDGTVRLWDARTGKPLSSPLQHQRFVSEVAFSPDGRTVATGSRDSTVRLWDARKRPFAPSLQHQGFVSAIAFSPDGRTVATGSGDNTARLWDARTGKSLALPLQHQELVSEVAFSTDGWTVATKSGDNSVRLWETRSGKPLAPPLKRGDTVLAMTSSPDGWTVATESGDDNVRLWDARTGKPVTPPLQHQGFISEVAFSPDGRTVATGSGDNTARLWDARTGKLLVPPLQHQGVVSEVTFSPDGRAVATSSGGSVSLWDARTGKLLAPPLQHSGFVSEVTFSPDGRTVATGSGDHATRLWDARTGKLLAHPLQHQAYVRNIVFTPNGKSFFVATDQWLNTYSWDGQKVASQSSQLLHGFWKEAFRFPPDCERCLQVALGDTGNSFHLETLRLDGPTDPPIEGDPKALLEKWQARLGLKFDEQMRPVPR